MACAPSPHPSVTAIVLAAGMLSWSAGVFGQTGPLIRHCTPTEWQADDVEWVGDVDPHNKIDDLIDQSTEALFSVVVNFKRCVSDRDIDRLESWGTVEYRLKYISSVAVAGMSKTNLGRLASRPEIAFIELQGEFVANLDHSVGNMRVSAGEPNSPNTLDDFFAARGQSITGKGVNIVIMDSGVDDPGPGSIGTTHDTLPPALFFYDAITRTRENPDDEDGHGTAVAAVALGRGKEASTVSTAFPRGVAPGAGLIDVRIAKGSERGDWTDYVHGLEYTYDNRVAWGVGIINLAYSQVEHISTPAGVRTFPKVSDGKDAFSQLIDLAEAMGIVVVASAGNDGPNRGMATPGAATRAITVAALDDQESKNRSLDTIWEFSTRGPRTDDRDLDPFDGLKPDVTAPGVDIRTALFNTQTDDLVGTGTSIAAPHVAGLAALILEARPGLNAASVKALILGTAERRGESLFPSRPGWNDRWGWGIVDGFAAVSQALVTDLTFPTPFPDPNWLSPDILVDPEPQKGIATVVTAVILNTGTVVARDVRIHFGVHDYSASTPNFDDIGTVVMDVHPGETRVPITWIPRQSGHLCLKVEIGYGFDADGSNNKVQRNLQVAKSPVTFRVQNTLTEGPALITFQPTLDPPTTDWEVTITPPSVTLAADDCPVEVSVLLTPKSGASPGSRQQVHVAARIGDTLLGGVTVEASVPAFPDCNGNGADDALDISGGASQDLNGSGVPDECEVGIVEWEFLGTAQGGTVSSTIQGFSATCTVTITTSAGQSAADVAAAFAAAINSDACLAGQGIVAQVSGARVQVAGLDLAPFDVSDTVTDPGLQHVMPIPAMNTGGAVAMALALVILGVIAIRRRQLSLR